MLGGGLLEGFPGPVDCSSCFSGDQPANDSSQTCLVFRQVERAPIVVLARHLAVHPLDQVGLSCSGATHYRYQEVALRVDLSLKGVSGVFLSDRIARAASTKVTSVCRQGMVNSGKKPIGNGGSVYDGCLVDSIDVPADVVGKAHL